MQIQPIFGVKPHKNPQHQTIWMWNYGKSTVVQMLSDVEWMRKKNFDYRRKCTNLTACNTLPQHNTQWSEIRVTRNCTKSRRPKWVHLLHCSWNNVTCSTKNARKKRVIFAQFCREAARIKLAGTKYRAILGSTVCVTRNCRKPVFSWNMTPYPNATARDLVQLNHM